MKKLVCMLLLFTLLISSVTAFAGAPEENQLELLKQYGIMKGDPDGNLRLDQTITRAEVAKMVISALNFVSDATPDTEKSEFSDVWDTHWAKLYINKAKRMGIVNGDEKGNFNPENNVTNEEVVKMLVNILGYKEMAESSGGYPAGYLMVATRINLLDGLSLVIGKDATREDVAVMFAQALEIPLMAHIDWGTAGEDEYIIFNGENGMRKATILSEYWEIEN